MTVICHAVFGSPLKRNPEMTCTKYDVAVGTCQSRGEAEPCQTCAPNHWPYGNPVTSPGHAIDPEILEGWKKQIGFPNTQSALEYIRKARHEIAQEYQIEAIKRKVAELNTKHKFQAALTELDKLNRDDLTTVQAYISARLEVMNRG